MPRNARLVDPGLPFHVTQRGNRHVDVFLSAEDHTVYLDLMRHQLDSEYIRSRHGTQSRSY